MTMVWGFFYCKIKGPLPSFPSVQQKASDFIKYIYKKSLIPFLNQADPLHKLSLMEDNAPIHTSKASQSFVAESSIMKIDWLSPLPDMNPIESVWFLLKSNFQELHQPWTIPEMHEALKQVWQDFLASTLDHLVELMPHRHCQNNWIGLSYPRLNGIHSTNLNLVYIKQLNINPRGWGYLWFMFHHFKSTYFKLVQCIPVQLG